ncbi:MAG TPA: NAD(+) synthase [Gemmatimonadaceae bacterium]|nr:NAD(+) synthase [Gemmatimonadaceae bacterium]
MPLAPNVSVDLLRVDAAQVTDEITAAIDAIVHGMRKRGVVLGLSGGVDSSVCAALCARALGPERVLGLLMPERESSPESLELGRLAAQSAGISTAVEDISSVLDAAGCYTRRDAAIRTLIPEYAPDWRCKVMLPSVVDTDQYRILSVVAQAPDGTQRRARLTPTAYLELIAATSFKQRTRKMMEYYHADRLNFAVVGTPNRLEYDQGFFVKNGDGAADIKPIAHLYKSQVYQIAEYLGVPETIRTRPPTTDTYSLPQTQEEFYFSLPYDKMDLCLFARDSGIDVADVGVALGLTEQQVQRVFRDIDAKRRASRYLHLEPQLVAGNAAPDAEVRTSHSTV